MEKLKYFAMALLVTVSAGFVSCSDDDDNGGAGSTGETPAAGIVGLWRSQEDSNVFYAFSDDGNYEYALKGSSGFILTRGGTYTFENGVLKLHCNSVSGGNFEFPDEDDEYVCVFEGGEMILTSLAGSSVDGGFSRLSGNMTEKSYADAIIGRWAMGPLTNKIDIEYKADKTFIYIYNDLWDDGYGTYSVDRNVITEYYDGSTDIYEYAISYIDSDLMILMSDNDYTFCVRKN